MISNEWVRNKFAKYGSTTPQPASQWLGEFPVLPSSLEHYYLEIGPADIRLGEEYGNGWFIPCLSGLWKFQEGYRWHGYSGQREEGWLDDWLAVATDFTGVFVLSRASGTVSYALHGGPWEPVTLFPDIVTMSACFVLLAEFATEAGDRFVDEDSVILPEVEERIRVGLAALLGSRPQAQTVLHELGYF